jgi:hypothetical protein
VRGADILVSHAYACNAVRERRVSPASQEYCIVRESQRADSCVHTAHCAPYSAAPRAWKSFVQPSRIELILLECPVARASPRIREEHVEQDQSETLAERERGWLVAVPDWVIVG